MRMMRVEWREINEEKNEESSPLYASYRDDPLMMIHVDDPIAAR